MQQKLKEIQKHLPLIEFCSAGKNVYNEAGSKHLVIPHTDGHKLTSDTNTLKAQLDNKYIVIDADDANLEELSKMFPSINSTFATQTTNSHKRHYYFLNSDIPPVRKLHLQADGDYDILTTGIIYEGHTIPGQKKPWTVINSSAPAVLTAAEISLVKSLVHANKSYQPRTNAYFLDNTTAALVEQVLTDKCLPKGKTDYKHLLFGILNEEFRQKHKSSKKRVELPPLSHEVINTIAYKLSYNMGIAHTERDEFLRILLKEAYGIDPDSRISLSHLQQSILATLPRHDKLEMLKEVEDFKETITHTIIDGWAMVKFINERGEVMYLEIHPTSFKPRLLGKLGTSILKQPTVASMRQYSKEDFQMLPLVKVEVNPFNPTITFDDFSDIDTLNLIVHTRYYEEATARPEKPNNVLARLIHSYLGEEYQDFYYHWLAHSIFNTRAPQTMPMFVSPKSQEGSTGKSSLAQAIPTRLISAATTADPLQTGSGWGDLVIGKKLLCFNDMKRMTTKQWEPVYSFAKDRTTSGARRTENMKFGGFTVNMNSIGFSFSGNWIPPLDEHDRRLWYVFPQSLYGDTELLNKEDASKVRKMLETSPLDDYHAELQEIANYCLYLFKEKKNKYDYELYQVAPHTKYRAIALTQQKNYSQSVLSAIKEGPESLETLLGNIEVEAKFIVLQYDGTHTYLPVGFMARLLNLLHPEQEPKRTRASVSSALDIEPSDFNNRGPKHIAYLDRALLGFDEFDKVEFKTYTQYQLKIPISKDIIAQYKGVKNELHKL